MPGFFETIASKKGNSRLLAAWIIEGEGAGAKALFDRSGILFRDRAFPQDAAEEIRRLSPERDGIAEIGNRRIYSERISGEKNLVICGAGHVSLCLIRLAVMLDWRVTVIEDREEYAEKAREAGAGRVICRPFSEALEQLEEDPSAAFVIMTREHAYDVDCLRQILRKPRVYAGMMGSRGRSEQIRRQLLEEGFDADAVREVHMPIGLPIGSRTPEEISVSVAAELIQVMNAAEGGEGFPAGMAAELAALEAGKAPEAVLALIVEKSGEAPRRPGTKMLVKSDGHLTGTVGGGYAEAVILKTAESMLREGSAACRLVRISMQKGAMYCGGEITVLLLPVGEFIQNS